MKKNIKRIIAATLASVMLFTDCASGFAAEVNTDSGTELKNESQDSEQIISETMKEDFTEETDTEGESAAVLFEMEELREQSAKHYRLSDGTVLAAQYGMDVHYEDEDGAWEEIDNRFLYEEAEDAEDFDGFRSAEGDVEFKFAPQVQEGELVKITQDEYSVGFELLPSVSAETYGLRNGEGIEKAELSQAPITFLQGEVLNAEEIPQELLAVPAVMSLEEDAEVIWTEISQGVSEKEEGERLDSVKVENAVTSVGYGNVFPGVSFQYVLAGSSLKEYILVNQKLDRYSFDFDMNLENLEPQMQEDGSIILKDAETGDAVYEIPAGYMQDAAGEYSDAVTMNVVENGEGSWILNVTADEEWMNAEERVFPIQIDPTLNMLMGNGDSGNSIRVGQIESKDKEKKHENPVIMMIGYTPGNWEQRAYVQLRNLPELPENSVICKAACYFNVHYVGEVGMDSLDILAQKVVDDLDWEYNFRWSKQLTIDQKIMDYRKMLPDDTGYLAWDITELIKEHYSAEDSATRVSTFRLCGRGADQMSSDQRVEVAMFVDRYLTYPIFSVSYRDTKGVEGYFTYQTHYAGNAGNVYVGDYNGQLTLTRPAGAYESTTMPYGLNLIYNSAYSDIGFSNHGNRIQSKDFTNMKLGVGWKLSAQETVVAITMNNANQSGSDTEITVLVYNDSDGTEHYFRQSDSTPSLYEDEDGMNLTITQNGNDFTMKDKQDNEKFFKNGYLTRVTDANGNKIHIVYNNGNPDDNVPNFSGGNHIAAVYSQPNGQNAKKIFELVYNTEKYLTSIKEIVSGRSYEFSYQTQNGRPCLTKIENAKGSERVETARYEYSNSVCSLSKVFDPEAERGIHYEYKPSMTGYRVSSYEVYAGDHVGSRVEITSDEHRRAVYRDYGADKIKNSPDDIITTCLFNSYGQTINMDSRDHQGNLLGVTATQYTSNNGTSGKNNRVLQNISSGQSGINLLSNGGFEKNTSETSQDPQATGWTQIIQNGFVACRKAMPHSGSWHYNMYNANTSGNQMILQSLKLEKGKTYTASAYVKLPEVENLNTADCGVYFEIHDAQGNRKVTGEKLANSANANIDGGWQRISVSYEPESDATYKICLVWKGIQGTVRVDDVQLEVAETPGRYSYVSNGSFEHDFVDWTRESIALEAQEEAAEQEKTVYGDTSFATKGEPGQAVYASQTIALNKSKDTTFLLSGWSKGDSIASVGKTGENTTDKFWGISLTFEYSDNSTENHYLPFSEYIRDWQYASMAVVPKNTSEGVTIRSAMVKCCYYQNANTVRFDNISLTEEPAQTYVYDEKGNLVSIKSTGNGTEHYSYDTGTQNLLSMQTPGSGNYTYEYQTTGNKHLPVKVTNDNVNMDISYDTYGQATETVLSNTKDSTKMKSSASYSDGLLTAQTDNTGAETKYLYTGERDLYLTENAKGQKIHTYKDTLWDRTDITYQSKLVSTEYQYEKGNLSQIIRGGYLKEKTEPQENEAPLENIKQVYGFFYDEFGNRTKTQISDVSGTNVWTLATYDYSDNFENLEKMTYGPENAPIATVHYAYDKLDRVKNVTYDNDSEEDFTYGYKYSADGNLSEVMESDEKIYDYTYDSLGRLIYSTKFENGDPVLRTSHQYDSSDRIKEQDWQIGNTVFSESYEYNGADGTLKSMSTGGDSLSFEYNNLKQLSKRTSPKLDMDYVYQTVILDEETYNTSLVSEVGYTAKGSNAGTLPTLKYSYDVLGNITEIDAGSGNQVSYVYDKQNQLTSANTQDRNSSYVYDTYGNIRSKTNVDLQENRSEIYTYTYGNAGWKDLLTKVSYKGFDGTEVTQNLEYDAIGNPIEYFNGKKNWEFEWINGRQLSKATTIIDGQTTIIENTYDVDGIRETKTVNGILHKYVTLDGKVVRETYGTATVDYFYDNNGRPYKFMVKEGNQEAIEGYYVLNLQGDVIAILDKDGSVAVQYEYDPWGKEIGYTPNGSNGNKLYQYNALKYRGYYYDVETGFYYVSSRYYDPEIGRFINADSQLNGGEGPIGYNMYAYCNNNPVMYSDPTGHLPFFAITAAIGAAVGAVVGGVKAAKAGKSVWKGALKGAAVGGLIGLGAGAAGAALITGHATATTAAVLGTASVKLAATGTAAGMAASKGIDYLARGYEKASSAITGATNVYRSISSAEAANIMSTNQFNFPAGGMEAKQFAFSYGEALKFGSQSIINQTSIVSASVPNSVLSQLYTHNVDYGIFTGIITVDYETIGLFNEAVAGTIRIMP